MHRIIFQPLVILFLLFPVPQLYGAQPSGLEIMGKVHRRETGTSSSAEVTMTLINEDGSRRVRQMKILSKQFPQFMARTIYFQAPADVQGTSFLVHDYHDTNRDTEQWLYLPALQKTKRLATSDKSSSFMGSDLRYGDMDKDTLDQSTYRLVKEGMVHSQPVWIIEAIPKTDAYALKKGYTKSLLLVRKDNNLIIRSVNWLLDSNRIRYMDVMELTQDSGIWAPTKVRIWTTENKKTIHQTYLETVNIRFNLELADELFSLRQLERGF